MKNMLKNKTTLSIILLSIAISYTSHIIAMQPSNTEKFKTIHIKCQNKEYFINASDQAKVDKKISAIIYYHNTVTATVLPIGIAFFSGIFGAIVGDSIENILTNNNNNKTSGIGGQIGIMTAGLLAYWFTSEDIIPTIVKDTDKDIHRYLKQTKREYIELIKKTDPENALTILFSKYSNNYFDYTIRKEVSKNVKK